MKQNLYTVLPVSRKAWSVPSFKDNGTDGRVRNVIEQASAAERAAAATLPSDDPLDPERLRRTLATLPELVAQPAVIERNWAANAGPLQQSAKRIAAHAPDRVFLAGAGDSLAVAVAARLAFESVLGVPCEPVESLELAYFQKAVVTSRALVIALSSSGETTRTVQAMLVGQSAGAMTLAVTNSAGSTLAAQAADTLLVDATRVGWPTQSSTVPLALLLRLAGLVGVSRALTSATELLKELDTMPGLMARAIAVADPVIAVQAAQEMQHGMYVFTGAGPLQAAAVVAAAKVKECTPDHAVAVQLEEFHHYNSVKAGEPVWLFAPSGPLIERGVDTVHEAHRLHGHVHAVTTEGELAFDGIAASVLALPPVSDALSPLLYFMPAQLIGYHLAVAKFAAAEAGVR